MTILEALLMACACIAGALVILAFGVGAGALIAAALERHPVLGVVVIAVVTIPPTTLLVWILTNWT